MPYETITVTPIVGAKISDNRCVRHMAMWDHYPRVPSGFRVTVTGDILVHRPN